ncbi:MAG: (d)CMP kinase [Deltaproteobacteria bacterium]|nr:(d)CMP kinase [Deltaproteobacteria bacterium]
MIIAIDGPAGSGKSTIAKQLAKKLKIEYFDSGSVYRCLTLYGMNHFNQSCEGYESEIAQCFLKNPGLLEIRYVDHRQTLLLEGEDPSKRIRSRDVTRQVRFIASNPECRDVVNAKMRSLAKTHCFAIDGRDIGSVVFPETPYKIYLDADVEVRAKRRALEMGIELNSAEYKQLANEIQQRDQGDRNRTIAPLILAEGAKKIDTTKMTVDDVVKLLLDWIDSNPNN